MRIRFFGRVLAALTGLIVLFLGACVLIFGLGVFPFKINLDLLEGPFVLWQRLVIIAAALVLCMLGIYNISILFRRRRDKGFIMQHTEYGDMSISMHAMENMVKKCIDTHEELKVTHTRIHRTRDGVVVDIRISLANGVNIPLTVNALQKQIKHYITSCSGVDVKEVRVMVETGNQSPKSAEVIAPDLYAADASVAAAGQAFGADAIPAQATVTEPENGKESIHQRLFKHQEAPQIVPEAPKEETQPPAEEEQENHWTEEQTPDLEGESPAVEGEPEADAFHKILVQQDEEAEKENE